MLLLWLLALASTLIGSLSSELAPPDGIDKLAHIGAYAALACVPVLCFRSRSTGLAIACAMMAVGIGAELGQQLVPGRYGSMADVVANGFGVMSGVLVGLTLRAAEQRAPALS